MGTPTSDTEARPAGEPRTVALSLLAIFAASFAALSYQFLHPGFHFQIFEHAAIVPKHVYQFVESFRQGIVYPRWMAEDFGGYGSPAFVFYSPLLYVISSALFLAGMELPLSITSLELARLFVGGLFVFLLVRGRRGVLAGTLASLFYVLLPSRMIDLYMINTPAGRFCQVWMPMLLYFTDRCARSPLSRSNVAGVAVSYAGLILSHLATAYLFTPFVAIWGLLVSDKRDGGTAANVILGLAAGIGLSGVFFLPVLFGRGLVNVSFFSSHEDYAYWRNFIISIRNAHRVPGVAVITRAHEVALGMETALLGAMYMYSRAQEGPASRRGTDRDVSFLAGASLACLFMMSSLSGPVWELLPGLKTVAFPFRFGQMYLLFISSLLGIKTSDILLSGNRSRAAPAVVAAAVLAVLSYSPFLVVHTRPVKPDQAALIGRTLDLKEYLPSGVDLEYAERLAWKAADEPLFSSKDDFGVEVERWGYVDRAFVVESPEGARLRLKTFSFPGWRAWIDGEEAGIKTEEGTGAMLIDVPAGEHELTLKFTDTPPGMWGAILSIFTLAAVVFPWRRIRAARPAS